MPPGRRAGLAGRLPARRRRRVSLVPKKPVRSLEHPLRLVFICNAGHTSSDLARSFQAFLDARKIRCIEVKQLSASELIDRNYPVTESMWVELRERMAAPLREKKDILRHADVVCEALLPFNHDVLKYVGKQAKIVPVYNYLYLERGFPAFLREITKGFTIKSR